MERQLPFALALLAAFAILHAPVSAADPPTADAAEELRGAELAKLALATEIASTPGGPDAEQKRKLDRLADAYLGIVKRHPDSAEARLDAGSFLWSLNRHDDAKAQWDAAAKLAPDNPEVAYSFGVWHLANGETRKAAESFARATELQPDNALYHHSLGNTLFVFRHDVAGGPDAALASALAHLRKAAELAPLSAEFAQGYAETFYAMPNPDWPAALEAWKHFLEVSADKDFAYAHLARISLRLGEREQAKAYLDRIADPRFRRLKEKLGGKLGPQ